MVLYPNMDIGGLGMRGDHPFLSEEAIDAVAKLMALEHVRANGTEAEYDWDATEDAWKRSFRLRARRYLAVAVAALENA